MDIRQLPNPPIQVESPLAQMTANERWISRFVEALCRPWIRRTGLHRKKFLIMPRMWTIALYLTLVIVPVLCSPVDVPYSTFSNNVIFTPPSQYTDPRVLYPRTLELQDGTLLATWENYSPEPPLVYFPIYQSNDHGKTWAEVSRVKDTVNSWGLRYQPHLFELRQPFGDFAVGTVLLFREQYPNEP